MITDEQVRAALAAFHSGDMDWDSQDEELMRLALEAAALSTVPSAGAEAVEKHMDAARDITILLANIDFLQEATGENLDTEDAAVVEQIREAWGGNGDHMRPSPPASEAQVRVTKEMIERGYEVAKVSGIRDERTHRQRFEDGLRAALTPEQGETPPSPETQMTGWVYDPEHPMSDGGDTRMTAAEEVLAYLLVEVVGSPDDVPYSPNDAQRILEDKLREGRRLETSYAEFLDQRRAALSTPEQEGTEAVGQNVVGKVEAFDKIVAARAAHVEAVEAYNDRLVVVRRERERGNFSMRLDDEYEAMSEAHAAWHRTCQDLADAALAVAFHPSPRKDEI